MNEQRAKEVAEKAVEYGCKTFGWSTHSATDIEQVAKAIAHAMEPPPGSRKIRLLFGAEIAENGICLEYDASILDAENNVPESQFFSRYSYAAIIEAYLPPVQSVPVVDAE